MVNIIEIKKVLSREPGLDKMSLCGTSFLPTGYEGNADELNLCSWHGGSEL